VLVGEFHAHAPYNKLESNARAKLTDEMYVKFGQII
jgi:hypothetical protein